MLSVFRDHAKETWEQSKVGTLLVVSGSILFIVGAALAAVFHKKILGSQTPYDTVGTIKIAGLTVALALPGLGLLTWGVMKHEAAARLRSRTASHIN
jgi:hypothetical protein